MEQRRVLDALRGGGHWASKPFHLIGSKVEDIDVVMTVGEIDMVKQQQALDCYVRSR